MKENVNSPSICYYVGTKMESKEVGKIVETMMKAVPQEELHKYTITIKF